MKCTCYFADNFYHHLCVTAYHRVMKKRCHQKQRWGCEILGSKFLPVLLLFYRVRQKKWTLKVFRRFLSNRLGFNYEILQLCWKKPSTSNCQIKHHSVEKRRSYRLFNMTVYRFFSIKKCSSYKCYLIFKNWLRYCWWRHSDVLILSHLYCL